MLLAAIAVTPIPVLLSDPPNTPLLLPLELLAYPYTPIPEVPVLVPYTPKPPPWLTPYTPIPETLALVPDTPYPDVPVLVPDTPLVEPVALSPVDPPLMVSVVPVAVIVCAAEKLLATLV